MKATDRKGLNQSDIPAEMIVRIREFRRHRFTIRHIAELIGWPKGRSTAVLSQIAGPMPKGEIGRPATCDEVLHRHVGCLYGGKW